MKTIERLVMLLGVISLLPGCVSHIGPYRRKEREFDPGAYGEAQKPQGASIYASAQRGLFEDDRASHVGDLIVIQVDENDTAQHDATTTLSKKNQMSMGLSGGLVDMLQKAMPAVALSKLLGTDSSGGFNGSGLTKRNGKISAMLPVRVRVVLPNSDLFVEGTKVVMVGEEEHHLYVSGIVRPDDVRADGSVSSSRVAEAEIEYTGRGDVSDYQRPGWLTRILNKVSPF